MWIPSHACYAVAPAWTSENPLTAFRYPGWACCASVPARRVAEWSPRLLERRTARASLVRSKDAGREK